MTDLSFSSLADRLIGQSMFSVLDKAQRLESQGNEVYRLEIGDPYTRPDWLLVKDIEEILNQNGQHYLPSSGATELKGSIAKLIGYSQGLNVDPRNVKCAPANYFISNFLSLVCDPRDKVIFITPAFPTYLAAAAMLDLDVYELPLSSENGYTPDEALFTKIRDLKPAAIIINSANNPTGSVYKESFLRELVKICESVNCWILSDETYNLLCYGEEFFSLLNLTYKKLVILSSLSKSFSVPGYRMGYCISRCQDFNEYTDKFLSTNISCSTSFVQLGFAKYLSRENEVNSFITSRREYYRAVIDRIYASNSWLKSNVIQPASAFYLFIPVPTDGEVFATELFDNDLVAVTPGKFFGQDFIPFIRVALCGKSENVLTGIKLITDRIELMG